MTRAAAIALLCAAVAGCKDGAPNLCSADVHCAAGFSCDPATGACRCDGDASCAGAETCNAAGFCQPKLRCVSTADCGKTSICDTPSGACISAQQCTLDVQCKQGQVCLADFTCAAGCRVTGDCPIGMVCRACPAGTPASECRTGNQCVLGPCDTQLSCPYGHYCLPDAGGEKFCTPDPEHQPYCSACIGRIAGSPDLCPGGAANYCLIDTTRPLGQAFYCGVDCSQGRACPNGYQCRDVRIVRAQNCNPANALAACPSGSVPCDPAKNHARTDGQAGIVNDDCEAAQPPLVGAVCDPKTGRCASQCTGTGEAGTQSFCSCIEDGDCPQDKCVTGGVCEISGKPCILGLDPDECASTNRIFCVKVSDPRLGPVGYCRIGQNCAPAEGFTCDRLRSGH